MFNEIDGDFDDVAIRTFKVGVPTEHDLRKSLTKKPVRSVCQLMNCIDKYNITRSGGIPPKTAELYGIILGS